MSSLYCTSRDILLRPDHEHLDSLAFNCTKEDNDAALKRVRRRAWTALFNKIKKYVVSAAIFAKLQASSSAIPRAWKPEDDLDGIEKARDVVSVVILLSWPNAHPLADSRPYLYLYTIHPYMSFPPPGQHPRLL